MYVCMCIYIYICIYVPCDDLLEEREHKPQTLNPKPKP